MAVSTSRLAGVVSPDEGNETFSTSSTRCRVFITCKKKSVEFTSSPAENGATELLNTHVYQMLSNIRTKLPVKSWHGKSVCLDVWSQYAGFEEGDIPSGEKAVVETLLAGFL